MNPVLNHWTAKPGFEEIKWAIEQFRYEIKMMDIFHMMSFSHFESQLTVIVMVDHADDFDTFQLKEPG